MKESSSTRILAVDWGAKHIGLALSDPTRIIASPLKVIEHSARAADAAAIVQLAKEKGATLILMGVTYDDENNLSPSGRSALRLAEAIQAQAALEVRTFDEAFSTQDARHSRLEVGLPRNKRKGHFDPLAAVVFLQSYLDENR
jgi:putative holliday junction resolvase